MQNLPIEVNKYYYIKVVHIGTSADIGKEYILRCKSYPDAEMLPDGSSIQRTVNHIGDEDLYSIIPNKSGKVKFHAKLMSGYPFYSL